MKVNPDFIFREIAGETMLIPVGSQSGMSDGIIVLTPTAAVIWKALAEGRGRDGALADILAHYEVDAETAAADLDEMLQRMLERGMVQE